MKSSMIMTVAAVLIVAAFAGVIVYDDEADAVDTYTITYQMEGGVLYQTGTAGEPLELYKDEATPALLGDYNSDLYDFAGWQTTGDSPVVYRFVADGSVSIVPSSDMTLVPYFELKTGIEVAYFVIGDDTYTIQINSGKVDLTGEIQDAVDAIDTKAYVINGWADSEGALLKADESNANIYAVESGATYTLQLTSIYNVTWIVDGTSIATGTTASKEAMKVPADPEKENYTFDAWYDSEGVKYTDSYVFTKDTTFTARFVADDLTVTLIGTDGKVIQTFPVVYGTAMVTPALPGGCAYWAVQIKAPTYDEEGNVLTEAEYAEYDFTKAVTEDTTLYAIASEAPAPSITVTFNIEGQYYEYIVTDRFTIPNTDRDGYEFTGWIVQGGDGTRLTNADVYAYEYTEDVTFVATYQAVEPPAPEEPGFFETTTGQIIIVLAVFIVVILIAAVYLNIWGLKDKIFGWKVVKKE